MHIALAATAAAATSVHVVSSAARRYQPAADFAEYVHVPATPTTAAAAATSILAKHV